MSFKENQQRNSPQGSETPSNRHLLLDIQDKTALLINLNLVLLNLLLSINTELNRKEKLPDEFINELKKSYRIVLSMFSRESSDSPSLKILGLLKAKLSEIILTHDDSISDEESGKTEKISEAKSEQVEDFIRYETMVDKWGIIESLDSVMESYSNLSHLAFPSFYLQAIKEIQRFEINKEKERPNSHEIIQIPALRIKNLVLKLLREAPSARLLQNLKKMFPLQNTGRIEEYEKKNIQDIVVSYFSSISSFMAGEKTLQDGLRVSNSVLQQYNLGPGDLESRIPNVSFIIVKDINNEFNESQGNDFKQYILSETIVLIHRLNGATLQDEKYRTLLRRLK
ncbi:MAG: hypothetical protein ACXABI_08155 [Candidatus Hodarchaeales archaeon]|jgi:hypothetical protein